jgi:hypothetical protein
MRDETTCVVELLLTTIPEDDVNGLIPRLNPSSSLMTVIRGQTDVNKNEEGKIKMIWLLNSQLLRKKRKASVLCLRIINFF